MVFSEIYGSYYNVVAAVIEAAIAGNLDRKKITKIVELKAFGESVATIPDNLLKQKWPLIDDNLKTPIRNVPTMPLSDIQRMWLRAILDDPRIQLFEPSNTGLEDVEPLFDRDTFVFFDRYSDGDPYNDPKYREIFRCVLTSVREHRKLNVIYNGRKGKISRIILPEKIEYSSKDDKFRLIGLSTKGTSYVFNIARIDSCEVLTQYCKAEPVKAVFGKQSVILKLTDERNALERVMLSFSDLEKETEKLSDKHYRIKLCYQSDDVTEILIRILAFGPMLEVIEPREFRDMIKERVFGQKSCEL